MYGGRGGEAEKKNSKQQGSGKQVAENATSVRASQSFDTEVKYLSLLRLVIVALPSDLSHLGSVLVYFYPAG